MKHRRQEDLQNVVSCCNCNPAAVLSILTAIYLVVLIAWVKDCLEYDRYFAPLCGIGCGS